MNSNSVIIGAACMGLLVNTLALLTVAWKGGELGQTLKTLAVEVGHLREWREHSSDILSRAVAQLDNLERRVERLEKP